MTAAWRWGPNLPANLGLASVPKSQLEVRAGGRQDPALLPGSKQAQNLASLLWAFSPASLAPSQPWDTSSQSPSRHPPTHRRYRLLPIELQPPHSSPISASLPPPAIGYPHQPIHLLLTPTSPTPPLHLYSGYVPPPHAHSLPTCFSHHLPLPALPFHIQSPIQHASPLSFCPIPSHPFPTSVGKSIPLARRIPGIRNQKLLPVPLQLDS